MRDEDGYRLETENEELRAEVERLRSQMDLFDPSTTKEMAAAALNFANDEIKRLQEKNHALRQDKTELLNALKHIVHWHDQLSVNDIAKAKAAIAKATGGE